MKSKTRRYFTQADKTLMWDRWQKGESLHSIARLFDTSHSAISGVNCMRLKSDSSSVPGFLPRA